jgi:hypothetical protein
VRLRIAFLMLAVLATACGEEGLLDGVGDRTQRAVVGPTTTTEAPDGGGQPDNGERFVASTAVGWYNDEIADQAIGLPAFTISEVWDRGHENQGRFIQSSRAEIAVALPGIKFPARVPSEVISVTSQLVYLEDVASLDAGTSAAFGLWEAEPYSSDDRRVGVLRVGATRDDVALGEVVEEVVTAGLSLIWTDGRYRYELFCRASLPADDCHEMVVHAAPLRDQLPTSV